MNVLFALSKPLILVSYYTPSALSTDDIFYYTPITVDWLSLIMLMVTLNEIAAIQISYQQEDDEVDSTKYR